MGRAACLGKGEGSGRCRSSQTFEWGKSTKLNKDTGRECGGVGTGREAPAQNHGMNGGKRARHVQNVGLRSQGKCQVAERSIGRNARPNNQTNKMVV